jgi:hypothetical protein
MKNIIITPEWNSKVHEIFISSALENKYKLYSASTLSKRTLKIWIRAFFYLPLMFAFFATKRLSSFSIKKVNIGTSIIQEVIRNSKSAQFYRVKNFLLILKVYVKALAVLTNFYELKKSHPNIRVLGGDSAYVTFSIISQLVHKSIYIVAQDLVSITEFDHSKLTASGAHRWLNPLDYGCTTDGLSAFLKEDFQKKKIYMHDRPQKFYNGEYIKRCIYIYTHDFFDSPGVYGNNVFTDHVMWIDAVLKLCKKYSIPVKLKRHPNERIESSVVAQQFENRCDVIFDNLDLEKIHSSEGTICTVYGTVSNEAYLHKVNVIACGDGPFNLLPNVIKASSFDHLELIISRLKNTNKLQQNYVVKTKQNIADCFTLLGNSRFNYGFNLPYNDCWNSHWENFMLGDYPPESFERRNRLKAMSKVEQEKFIHYLSKSTEFNQFKIFIQLVISNTF